MIVPLLTRGATFAPNRYRKTVAPKPSRQTVTQNRRPKPSPKTLAQNPRAKPSPNTFAPNLRPKTVS
jgi:hypothetical protein